MKHLLTFVAALGWACLPCLPVLGAGPSTTGDAVVRQKLVQAVLSDEAGRPQLLGDLGGTGSKLVGDVLSAWARGGVYFYVAPDGSKVPVMLEDAQDADGKARAVQISDGLFVKDAGGKELRFGDSDLNAAETDMRLRSTLQQTVDTLALSNPDVDARWSAVTKLGNSQKPMYIPILQARLAK